MAQEECQNFPGQRPREKLNEKHEKHEQQPYTKQGNINIADTLNAVK